MKLFECMLHNDVVYKKWRKQPSGRCNTTSGLWTCDAVMGFRRRELPPSPCSRNANELEESGDDGSVEGPPDPLSGPAQWP